MAAFHNSKRKTAPITKGCRQPLPTSSSRLGLLSGRSLLGQTGVSPKLAARRQRPGRSATGADADSANGRSSAAGAAPAAGAAASGTSKHTSWNRQTPPSRQK